MTYSGDELRTALAATAIALSIASLYFSRKSWLQSNRPIVTAFVTEHWSGSTTTTFNMVVSNTGNRPATNIRVQAKSEDIETLTDGDAPSDRNDSVKQCFSEEATVPLLRNGEELTTAFGAFSSDPINGAWLNYEKQIEIEVSYRDLDGRKYRSRMPLKIYARHGFGGSVWA